jgi:YbgC/YbaW family acyl-CoA thioester hydrolase
VTPIVARFSDLDPYDHVNHARYLSYFESARIEMLEEMGFGMDVMKRDGVQIVLVELTAAFHTPALLHDRLDVATSVVEVRRATTRWRQEAHRSDELVATLDVRAAFTGIDGRPRRAPEGFAEAAARVAGA